MKRVFVAVLVAALVSACGNSEPKSRRVIVLGFDGLDPTTVDLLLSEGKLPNFARIRREGAYAPLLSAKPLLSPVVWTTIATGKTPDQHRIGHFVAIDQKTGEQLPVTSRMRGAKAIWNILSENNREVSVIGWWATWPPETIRGSIVSDHLAYHFLFAEGLEGAKGTADGAVYPPDLLAELTPHIRRPQDLSHADISRYVTVDAEEMKRPVNVEDDLSHFRWALATAQTYRNIGLHIWSEKKPQQLMVYIEGTDSTSHLFGHLFRAGDLAGELAVQQKRYGNAVEEMYLFADRILGDYIAAMDDDTALVVLSDHGFELGKLQEDPSKTRDMRRVSEEFHRLRGILYLFGDGIKRGNIDRPTILDIAPTLLALNGLGPPSDMPGRVLTEALAFAPPPPVASYEPGGTQAQATAPSRDPRVDPEMIKRLQSLGYIQSSSPAGDSNLAAVLFEQGKYREAADAYRALVEREPENAAFRASLAGSLGALGDYDGALEHLTKSIAINPVNPEAYHNRAVVQERKGNLEAAIKDYQTALRYSPQYEPSLNALARLGVSQLPNRPRNDEERRAFKLAEKASTAAIRGDYPAAMKLLDEAAAIAPRFALIYQYRANVAYLMGDHKAAAKALRKGLEIEPDNALFRENLKRVEQQDKRGT